MCLEANWQQPDATAQQDARFDTLPTVTEDGLRYTPRHAFRATTGVPGVVYDVARAQDDEAIGSAVLLLSDQREAVMHVGHIGCEIAPAHRKQGHTTRLMHALVPVLRSRGVGDVLLACDVGHASQYQSITAGGAQFLGDTFGDDTGHCGARFVLPA